MILYIVIFVSFVVSAFMHLSLCSKLLYFLFSCLSPFSGPLYYHLLWSKVHEFFSLLQFVLINFYIRIYLYFFLILQLLCPPLLRSCKYYIIRKYTFCSAYSSQVSVPYVQLYHIWFARFYDVIHEYDEKHELNTPPSFKPSYVLNSFDQAYI